MTIEEFNIIFKAYRYKLYRYACQFVQQFDAEEIASRTFIKLWEKQPHFNNTTALNEWLYLVTKNHCLDFIKVSSRKRLTDIEGLEIEAENNIPLIELENEVIQAIVKAISKLSPQQKQVFELKYFHQYSVGEISKQLHLSPQTISNILYSAMTKLRGILKHPSLITITCLFIY